MEEKLSKLEKQVADLTKEVARLRRLVFAGLVVLGILLVGGLVVPGDAFFTLLPVGLLIGGVIYIAATLVDALARRAERKRQRHIA